MPKKSILSAFFEGGAAALYAAAKKGDIEQEDQEKEIGLQSKREALKQQQYGNSAIGANALDVPEDTPHSYANTMIGMRAKDAKIGSDARKADAAQTTASASMIRAGAYKQGIADKGKHYQRMDAAAFGRLGVSQKNAETAANNYNRLMSKDAQNKKDSEMDSNYKAARIWANRVSRLMTQGASGGDTSGIGDATAKMNMHMARAESGAPSSDLKAAKPKKMPDSIWKQYSALGPKGQAAFRNDNPGYFD